MQRKALKHLGDAFNASRFIKEMLAGKNLHDYLNDRVLRAAVERQFEIIGEALNRLQKEDAALAARIPELRQIVSFRNFLIHGYDSISDTRVWNTATSALPVLSHQVRSLIDELEAD